jgi:nucleoside-diphosphate kinase
MKIQSVEKSEDSLMIIKPDGMRILSDIFSILHDHNIRIKSIKSLTISPGQAEAVYQDLKGKYFFTALIEYLTMAPSMVLAIKGQGDAIAEAKKNIRLIAQKECEKTAISALLHFFGGMTSTEKVKANLEDLGRKFQIEYGRTFDGIHCSDIGAGKRELAIFFSEAEVKSSKFDLNRASVIVKHKLEGSASLQSKPCFENTIAQSVPLQTMNI